MTVATPEFRALFDKILANILPATREIIASGDQHSPMVMMFDSEGWLREARLVEMGSIAEKDFVAALHRRIATNPSVGCAIFVSETWMISRNPKAGEIPQITGSLEHVPGRTEALMLSARKDEQHLFAMLPIIRPAEGKKGSSLGEPKIIDANDPKAITSGRFVGDDDHPPTRH